MGQLGQVSVDDRVNHESASGESLIERFIDLVFGSNIIHTNQAHRLISKLGQGRQHHFFSGFTGCIGKQIDGLAF